ncbi:unnamed protein product [Sphagnum tenellum]
MCSMSSPRSLPPASVLLRLQQQDGGDQDRLRKRCFSESLPLRPNHFSLSPSLLHPAPPNQPITAHRAQLLNRRRTVQMFRLDDSITKSTEQLGRISRELHTVNEDLSHLVDAKRQLSEEDLFRLSGDIMELCRHAQQDLRMADLARVECRSILKELGTAWLCEEKDMVTRAGWLRRESEASFEKMSPMALRRLQEMEEEAREAAADAVVAAKMSSSL